MEGRFPCVSGVKFSFDPSKPAGERVVEGSVSVSKKSSGEFKPLDLDQNYRVVSKAYLLKGKDGYDMLAGQKVVVDDENCPGMFTASICSSFVIERMNRMLISQWKPIAIVFSQHWLLLSGTCLLK